VTMDHYKNLVRSCTRTTRSRPASVAMHASVDANCVAAQSDTVTGLRDYLHVTGTK